ncbi:MAG: hypothetical protein J6T96_13205 [Bacteroidales bacterium]|nr:hypothetical protein [Bacteroidales bacterium]
MRKEYGDFWDKQRLIDACLELCENKWGSELLPKVKSNHSKITEIQIKRLQAVLKTHNIDYNFLTDDFDFSNSAIELSEVDEDLDEYLIMCSGIIHLVSYSISSEDLTELKKLINQNSRHAYLLDEKCHLECYSTRCVFFDEILGIEKKFMIWNIAMKAFCCVHWS